MRLPIRKIALMSVLTLSIFAGVPINAAPNDSAQPASVAKLEADKVQQLTKKFSPEMSSTELQSTIKRLLANAEPAEAIIAAMIEAGVKTDVVVTVAVQTGISTDTLMVALSLEAARNPALAQQLTTTTIVTDALQAAGVTKATIDAAISTAAALIAAVDPNAVQFLPGALAGNPTSENNANAGPSVAGSGSTLNGASVSGGGGGSGSVSPS